MVEEKRKCENGGFGSTTHVYHDEVDLRTKVDGIPPYMMLLTFFNDPLCQADLIAK